MARAFNKLTRPAMRSLRPGDGLTEHGINFERIANGDGVFSVNVMVDGMRIHRVVGREVKVSLAVRPNSLSKKFAAKRAKGACRCPPVERPI
jgi:hypothetical protein